ncbi:MAG: NADH-quinone oxidoreductase subunit NuoG [bacterium]
MLALTIDGKEIQVEEGITILEACEKAGSHIPTLCYDRRLLPFGACRICLVEVEGARQKFTPSCTTPATNGMVVKTISSDIIKARKTILELLLINHPLDCPVCDKAGECTLQDLVYEYGIEKNRFKGEKANLQVDHQSHLIERNLNRCILCGKCTRICDELQDVGETSFVNRGIRTKIGTDFDRPLNCEFCGQCIDICPVGALTSKLFKYKARIWELKEVKTICPFCSTGCQINLGIKDNKILRVTSDGGNLCSKGRFGFEYVHSDQRITTPLIKKDGELVEASWEEALNLVAEKFKEIKENDGSLAGLCSNRLTNEEVYIFQKLMRAGLQTNNIDNGAGYSYAGIMGLKKSLGYATTNMNISDIKKSDCIILLRCDISETHPIIGIEVNLAVKRNEAKLIIINARDIKLAKLTNLSLIYYPKTEIALLNGMINVLINEGLIDKEFISKHTDGFDGLKKSVKKYTPVEVEKITGVDKELIINAAKTFGNSQNATILISTGLNLPGEDAKLAQAAANLALLTGNLGKEGAGITILGEKNNSQGTIDMGAIPEFFPGYQEITDSSIRQKFEEAWKVKLPSTKGLGALEILEEGKIKGLYIVGENPIETYPDSEQIKQALEALDFLVVQDIFLTQTAKLADVVLPACSFAEKEGTFTNVERRLQKLNQALSPIGESRPDLEIFIELSKLLGYEMNYSNPEEVMDEINNLVPIYASDKFKGKFIPQTFEGLPGEDKYYPFLLLTGNTHFHSGSMSGKSPALLEVCGEAIVEINSEDAKKLDVEDKELVKVSSREAGVELKAKISNKSPKGVIFVPQHPTINILSLIKKDLGDIRVRVEKIEG